MIANGPRLLVPLLEVVDDDELGAAMDAIGLSCAK